MYQSARHGNFRVFPKKLQSRGNDQCESNQITAIVFSIAPATTGNHRLPLHAMRNGDSPNVGLSLKNNPVAHPLPLMGGPHDPIENNAAVTTRRRYRARQKLAYHRKDKCPFYLRTPLKKTTGKRMQIAQIVQYQFRLLIPGEPAALHRCCAFEFLPANVTRTND